MAFGILGGTPQSQASILGGGDAAMAPPRIPWKNNQAVTMAALGMLGAPTINQGMQRAAAMVPAGMDANRANQQFQMQQQEKAAAKAEQARRNAAVNAAIKAQSGLGLSAEEAAALDANPELAQSIFGDSLKKRMGVGGATEYSLNTIPGVDADGNPVLIQTSKTGVATQAQLPEGVQISKEPIKLDAGTHYVLLDPITRQPVGQIAKDVAGQSAAQEEGAAAGKARVNLPGVEAASSRMIRYLDDTLKDPALPRVTGPVGGMLPTWMDSDPGGAARAQSRLDQIQGGTFLQAFEQLKGAGQITEVEGQKATDSLNRLRTQNMGDKDYLDALMEFRKDVLDLVELARVKANGGASTQLAPSEPAGQAPAAGGVYEWSPDTGEVRQAQ